MVILSFSLCLSVSVHTSEPIHQTGSYFFYTRWGGGGVFQPSSKTIWIRSLIVGPELSFSSVAKMTNSYSSSIFSLNPTLGQQTFFQFREVYTNINLHLPGDIFWNCSLCEPMYSSNKLSCTCPYGVVPLSIQNNTTPLKKHKKTTKYIRSIIIFPLNESLIILPLVEGLDNSDMFGCLCCIVSPYC